MLILINTTFYYFFHQSSHIFFSTWQVILKWNKITSDGKNIFWIVFCQAVLVLYLLAYLSLSFSAVITCLAGYMQRNCSRILCLSFIRRFLFGLSLLPCDNLETRPCAVIPWFPFEAPQVVTNDLEQATWIQSQLFLSQSWLWHLVNFNFARDDSMLTLCKDIYLRFSFHLWCKSECFIRKTIHFFRSFFFLQFILIYLIGQVRIFLTPFFHILVKEELVKSETKNLKLVSFDLIWLDLMKWKLWKYAMFPAVTWFISFVYFISFLGFVSISLLYWVFLIVSIIKFRHDSIPHLLPQTQLFTSVLTTIIFDNQIFDFHSKEKT